MSVDLQFEQITKDPANEKNRRQTLSTLGVLALGGLGLLGSARSVAADKRSKCLDRCNNHCGDNIKNRKCHDRCRRRCEGR